MDTITGDRLLRPVQTRILIHVNEHPAQAAGYLKTVPVDALNAVCGIHYLDFLRTVESSSHLHA